MANTFYVDVHGTWRWYNEAGQLHRLDGPAVECVDGTSAWYKHGTLHRVDGPAFELANGYKEYRLEGKRYSNLEDFCNDAGITGKHKTLLLLKHSLCLIQ